jgi:outer membrane immunogenic protein
MGSVVVGLEADFALANISDEVPDNDFIRQYTKIDMFGTARVRAGYAMGNFMPFITGGLAFARAQSGEICPDGATGGWCLPSRHGAYDLSETRWIGGWTIGGGVEAAFNRNWTLRAEYLYVDFGKERHVLDPLGVDPNPAPPRPSASDRNADWTMHVLRATLNYKF